jgi:ABC-type multidrug transport system permease subunit
MSNMMSTIVTFQPERPVFLRELANNMYSVTNYYLAKTLSEAPVLFFTPILFSCIVYFKIGLTITGHQFGYFYLTLSLITQCAASFGYLLSSVFDNEASAAQIAPIFIMPFVLFGGQFINPDNFPKWIGWFQYISPIRYGLESLVVNEFDSRVYNTTLILQQLGTNLTKAFPAGFVPPQN